MEPSEEKSREAGRHVKESYLKILDLRTDGTLTEEPVRLEFSFRASEKECLLWLRDQLSKQTDLLLEYVGSDQEFHLKAKTKPLVVTFGQVEERVRFLVNIAARFGCSYEGWEIVT